MTASTPPADPTTTGGRRHRVIPSPLGPLTLVVDAAGLLTGLYLAGQRHRPVDADLGVRDDVVGDEAVRQLGEYFAGRRDRFDLELAPAGTAFQHRVWKALAAVPSGTTTTYGALAASLGLPGGAARAVGSAVGRNPISIVVPCHRVVGRNGDLTGYAGGLDRKEWLLRHEGTLPAAGGRGPTSTEGGQ